MLFFHPTPAPIFKVDITVKPSLLQVISGGLPELPHPPSSALGPKGPVVSTTIRVPGGQPSHGGAGEPVTGILLRKPMCVLLEQTLSLLCFLCQYLRLDIA